MSEPPDISRRTFVLGTTATVAMSAAGARTESDSVKAPSDADLCNLSAVEAVAHMSKGALTSERYAQALLARCQSAHALNAFITLDPARVLDLLLDRGRGLERLRAPGPDQE